MRAINIQWDVDDEDDYELLPSYIDIPDGMGDDEISDYISYVTGFCHNGFELTGEEARAGNRYEETDDLCGCFTEYDFKQYARPINMTSRYGIICSSKTEAKECCLWMDSIGNTWCSGESFVKANRYECCGSGTITYYNNGTYGGYPSKEQLEEGSRYKFLTWPDFKKTLTPDVELEDSEELNAMFNEICVLD